MILTSLIIGLVIVSLKQLRLDLKINQNSRREVVSSPSSCMICLFDEYPSVMQRNNNWRI